MLGSSEATSECLGSVCMASGDEESHSSGREYTFDESFGFKRESSASSPFEEEVETCLPGQVCRKIMLPSIWSVNVFLMSMTKANKGEKCYMGRLPEFGFYEALIVGLRLPLSYLHHR